jgi:hypothetical protein
MDLAGTAGVADDDRPILKVRGSLDVEPEV